MAKTLTVTAQEFVPEFVQLAKKGKGNLMLSSTMTALEKLSTMYQEAWVNAASGQTDLGGGLPFVINSKTYQTTIERRQINPTTWEVFTSYTTKSGLSVTELLERGHGLIDLKDGLLRGPKSRQGKNGRYNIVAFRNNVADMEQVRSNARPMSVYKAFSQQIKEADAKKAAGASPTGGKSYVTKSSAQPGGREYSWGTRYDRKATEGMKTKQITKKGKNIGSYDWKAGKYAGMVAMQASTQRSKSSSYMTFRVVSSASDPMSWIVPEQPPWPVRKAITNFMRPFAEEILKRAMEQDMK